jgi:hypothetical protein
MRVGDPTYLYLLVAGIEELTEPCGFGSLTMVERLAIGAADAQAGDRHRVASPGVSALLEMEKSAWRWPPGGISGSSQSHPSNEPRQPALGRASH